MRLLIVSLFLLWGCTKNPTHFNGVAHTHPFHIQIGHPLSQREQNSVHQLIRETFEEIDLCYNHWNPTSDLSRGILTDKIQAILHKAQTFYELTGGQYDPTLGALVTHFKKTGTFPEKEVPKQYDLDGMLKGFTIDLLIDRLAEKGYQNLYVEWGGDLRVKGNHPEGRHWQILLNGRPFPLTDGALATSGCQEQIWEVRKTLYTHIMNPQTQKMVEVKTGMIHQVSVLAPSGALADALATACMACGTLEEGQAFAEKIKKTYPEIQFWITTYEL